jgi:hypothetical protein
MRNSPALSLKVLPTSRLPRRTSISAPSSAPPSAATTRPATKALVPGLGTTGPTEAVSSTLGVANVYATRKATTAIDATATVTSWRTRRPAPTLVLCESCADVAIPSCFLRTLEPCRRYPFRLGRPSREPVPQLYRLHATCFMTQLGQSDNSDLSRFRARSSCRSARRPARGGGAYAFPLRAHARKKWRGRLPTPVNVFVGAGHGTGAGASRMDGPSLPRTRAHA